MKIMNKAALSAAAGLLLTAPLGLSRAQAKTTDKNAASSWDQQRRAMWERRLGLSEKDAKKLDETFQSEKKTMRPLHRELRDALIKLSDQVGDNAADTEIQATLERVQKAKQALQTEKSNFRAKLAGLLTPTQRAKMMLWRMRRHLMLHGGMMGMGPYGPMDWRRGEGGRGCGRRPCCGTGDGQDPGASASPVSTAPEQ
jgi:Spy/CpxP family protein refolding chaperone